MFVLALLALISVSFFCGTTSAFETVVMKSFDRKSERRTIIGEVLVEAQDGGIMMQADDGRIWTIQPDNIVSRETTAGDLKPIDDKEITKRLLDQMPRGFRVYRTKNFVLVHNTNEAYVKRVGLLFEQLHKGFSTYWQNQAWKLSEPRFPLVALVLANHDGFLEHAEAEIGEMARSVIGYYHLETNWVTTFNVPNLERNIATIVHEATHQLAYNMGVQRRFADNPMWVSEGLALYFESPDFSNPRIGWRTIGRVNQVNLMRWKRYVRSRPEDSLATLIADDSRFRSTASAEDSYAESWALTYFLIKTRRKEYVAYMKKLSEGKPLRTKTPRERIEMFETAFGASVAEIDKRMVAFIARQR